MEVSYVRKTFKLLLLGLAYRADYHCLFHTSRVALDHPCSASTHTRLKQTFELQAIDTLCQGEPQ
jgi:hypothetical protein